MSLLIHNVTIFTNDNSNAILTGKAVVIEGTRIKEVGPEVKLKKQYAHLAALDGGGRLLMPGLINAHMHFYGTYARGLALRQTPANFAEILSFLWWPLDRSLDLEAVYYSALVPAITAVKNGVTAIIDHHASPNAVEGSLDRIEEALKRLGLRAVLCYEVSDRDGPDVARRGLEENARYIQKCRIAKRKNPDHLFDGMIGLHASFTLDNDTLQKAAELSWTAERGCHIHVLEDEVDRTVTREKYEHDVVVRLAEHGILGEKSIAAHGIHLSEPETDLLATTDTIVVHNPQSNMNNAVGRADILKLIDRQILLGIGTDGMSADLKPDVRTANLLHKHHLRNANIGWAEIQQLTLKNNPRIYQRLTGQQVGCVRAGYLADLILVDYFPPTPMTGENFWGHFLYGIADAVVDTTIVNGRILMRNKEIPDLDEAEIAAKSRECAKRVWKRFFVA